MAKIDAFFKLMNEQGASDLHLVAGSPPALRIRGEIERVKYKVLDNDDLRKRLGDNARRRAKDILEPWSKRMEKEAQLLEDVIQNIR